MKKERLIIAIAIILFTVAAVVMRFVAHPYNFIPVGALALFCGTFVRSRWAILLPVAAMALSDLFIGWHNLVLFTWGCYAISGMIGWWIRQRVSVGRVFTGSVTGSVIFYLVTNFAVWAFTPLYSKTLAGLVQSYVMAIPFYRNTFFGDLFYVTVFFGCYALVNYALAKRKLAKAPSQIN